VARQRVDLPEGIPNMLKMVMNMTEPALIERLAVATDAELDELDYLFTLQMKPSPVRLRLLKSAQVTARFVLVGR
jgi:hypothetical protein